MVHEEKFETLIVRSEINKSVVPLICSKIILNRDKLPISDSILLEEAISKLADTLGMIQHISEYAHVAGLISSNESLLRWECSITNQKRDILHVLHNDLLSVIDKMESSISGTGFLIFQSVKDIRFMKRYLFN